MSEGDLGIAEQGPNEILSQNIFIWGKGNTVFGISVLSEDL